MNYIKQHINNDTVFLVSEKVYLKDAVLQTLIHKLHLEQKRKSFDDTEILDNVQKALPEMSLDEIYGEDDGGVAKFTSLLTQYGTGFAIAQKIAKKLFGKAAKTKLAEKAAAVAATNKAANYGVNLAKYGGYWVLPAFAADTTVSATGQKSVGEIFGDESGNFLERALANTKLESLEGITNPKEYAAAVLRNKLKFGT